MDKRPIDIILPTFNRKIFLEIILNAIKDKAGYPYRVIIVLHPSEDDTFDFLNKNKHLYNVLIETSEKMFLSQTLNLGLQKVQSEDFAVMNDDILVGMDNWLDMLYSAYKDGYIEKGVRKEWFAMLPYIFPANKSHIDPLSFNNNVVETSGHISSWCRIQNAKKIRAVGGFKLWKRENRDFEGGTFGNISAQYKQKIGRHYGVKAIDLSVVYKYEKRNEIIAHFLKKGELLYELMESS